jgi:alpha-galactosidase
MLRILALAPLLALEAPAADASVVRLDGRGIRLEFDEWLRSRVVATSGGAEVAVGPFGTSESLETETGEVAEFGFDGQDEQPVSDVIGRGLRHRLNGRAGDVGKTVEVTFYDDFLGIAVAGRTRTTVGEIRVRSWTNGRYSVAAPPGGTEPAFWSYQSGSYESRPDWVLPLKIGFAQDNYQGMNASDYGGGTPVVDVWRRDLGVAVGHVEPVPRLVSLPVARPGAATASLAVRFAVDRTLRAGEASRRCGPSSRSTTGTTSGPSRRTADSWPARASVPPQLPSRPSSRSGARGATVARSRPTRSSPACRW